VKFYFKKSVAVGCFKRSLIEGFFVVLARLYPHLHTVHTTLWPSPLLKNFWNRRLPAKS
jgi:hypothetical protein